MSDQNQNLEESKQPLLQHLIELRRRLIKSLLVISILFVISYIFANTIYNFLVQPYASAVEGEEGRRLIFTALHETFFTYLKVALFSSIFISLPYILTQIWIFIAPGLYKNEKHVVIPYLVATPLLFLLGSALVYYFIMPLAIKFFLSFETIGGNGALPIQLEAKVNEYLSLIMRLIFAFGLSFQLPVLLTLLARVGFVSSYGLRKNRKFVIVGVFAVAAILTPPDPISQIGLGIPVLLLYEISIFAVKFIEKKKAKKD
jgi:sec-independent protein translocase protein TatC